MKETSGFLSSSLVHVRFASKRRLPLPLPSLLSDSIRSQAQRSHPLPPPTNQEHTVILGTDVMEDLRMYNFAIDEVWPQNKLTSTVPL